MECPHARLAESSDLVDDDVQKVGLPTLWAALDCVGGWGGGIEERRMVLGRMTAQVDAPRRRRAARRGRRVPGHRGRKTFTASTLYDSDGRIVARAQHVWIAVDPAAFG